MRLLRGCLRFLLGLVAFCSLFYLSFLISPYLVGSRSLPSEQQPSLAFPVLYQSETGYQVLFQRDPKASLQLVVGRDLGGKLENNERFELEQGSDGQWHLTYYADDYTHWSGYSVVNDEVKPNYYRINGAFMVMPVFGILGVMYLFGKMFWQWRRKVNKAKRSLLAS